MRQQASVFVYCHRRALTSFGSETVLQGCPPQTVTMRGVYQIQDMYVTGCVRVLTMLSISTSPYSLHLRSHRVYDYLWDVLSLLLTYCYKFEIMWITPV